MNEIWGHYIIPAGLGLVAGVVGSLVAPWVKWGIEKRRVRMESRRRLIADLRQYLNTLPTAADFLHSIWWYQLQEYLTQETFDALNNAPRYRISPRDSANRVASPLDDVRSDLVRLEKKWMLI